MPLWAAHRPSRSVPDLHHRTCIALHMYVCTQMYASDFSFPAPLTAVGSFAADSDAAKQGDRAAVPG
jgi:hypothetical protein